MLRLTHKLMLGQPEQGRHSHRLEHGVRGPLPGAARRRSLYTMEAKHEYKLKDRAVVAGMAIGAAATPGLYAQAKLKVYSVGEVEVIDAAAQPSYLPAVRKAIEQAHGHTLRTLNGRVQHIEGAAAPKNVAIVEWDSLDDAVAFYKSKAWTDLAPQRDKSQKTIRRYVVEVER